MKVLKRKIDDENYLEICNWEKEKELLIKKYGNLVVANIENKLKNPCVKKIGYMGIIYEVKRQKMSKDIELMKVRIDLDYENKFCLSHFNFRFKIEAKYYDLIMNPIDDTFRSGIIIEGYNKKILPSKILQHLKFGNGKKGYKITGCNIEHQNGHIIVSLEMKLISVIFKN